MPFPISYVLNVNILSCVQFYNLICTLQIFSIIIITDIGRYVVLCIFFIFILVSRKIIIEEMEGTARRYLERSVSLMESSFQNLKTNSVQIKMLEFFVSKTETFLAVANVFETHSPERLPLKTHALKNILRCREKDLKRLKEIIITVNKAKYFLNEISESKFATNILLEEY